MAERGPRRGRPRDPAVDEAVLAAAVELLADAGFARLTMEQVAARAGVGKASVYLRWPNKVTLLAEAIQHHTGVVPDVPDTGMGQIDLELNIPPALQKLRDLYRQLEHSTDHDAHGQRSRHVPEYAAEKRKGNHRQVQHDG